MALRTVAVGSAIGGFVAAMGFAIAYWVERGPADWLIPGLGVLFALLLIGWFARSADIGDGASLGVFILMGLAATVFMAVLTIGFLGVECKRFDNCPFN